MRMIVNRHEQSLAGKNFRLEMTAKKEDRYIKRKGLGLHGSGWRNLEIYFHVPMLEE